MSMMRFATILALVPLSAVAQSPTLSPQAIARIDSLFRKYDLYRDGFLAMRSTFGFTRGANGRVDGFLLTSGRVRRLRFERTSSLPARRD
jgi:hypothetical protein